MFDVNDMAKAAFEPILFTPLQRAQKDGYVNIIGAEGKRKTAWLTPRRPLKTMRFSAFSK